MTGIPGLRDQRAPTLQIPVPVHSWQEKRAYFSIVDKETLEIARNTTQSSYKTLRVAYRERALHIHMAYARKIFATWARRHVDPEIVDMLEGRAPTTVFARHYYRPDFRSELEKIRGGLPELRRILG